MGRTGVTRRRQPQRGGRPVVRYARDGGVGTLDRSIKAVARVRIPSGVPTRDHFIDCVSRSSGSVEIVQVRPDRRGGDVEFFGVVGADASEQVQSGFPVVAGLVGGAQGVVGVGESVVGAGLVRGLVEIDGEL